jgi:hypothetical protein
LSGTTFIAPCILNDSFAGKSILWLKLFSFTVQKTSLHALLSLKVSVEKSTVILIGLPLYVIYSFSLIAFNILSLSSVLVFLMLSCHGVVLFGPVCLVFLRLPVPEWA